MVESSDIRGGLVMRLKLIISAFFILFTIGCDEQNINDPITEELPATVEKQQNFILV